MKIFRIKCLFAVVVLIASIASFTRAESYASLLAKGKQYEKNKQYVHALSCYWDAMATEPTVKAEEAYEAYTTLIELITSGKPGYGNFDDMFDMYDGWVALLNDYSAVYGTSEQPGSEDAYVYTYSIEKSDEKSKPAMKTRSWMCYGIFNLGAAPSKKHAAIYSAVKTGFYKSRTKDWEELELTWHENTSIQTFHKIKSEIENSINSKIKKAWEEWLVKHKTEAENRFMPVKNYEYVYDRAGDGPDFRKIIGITRGATWSTFRQSDIDSFPKISWPGTEINAQIAIIDGNGKQLAVQNVVLGYYYDYDTGNISIHLPTIEGRLDPDVKHNFVLWIDDRNIANAFDTGNVHLELLSLSYCGVTLDSKILGESNYDVVEKYKEVSGIRAEEESRKLAEFKKNGLAVDDVVRVKGDSFDFYIMKTEVTQGQYAVVMGNNPSHFKGDKRPVEMVSWCDALWYCNRLSVLHGLEPCYSIDGDTNLDHFSKSMFGQVKCNNAANGWRLPTVDEWRYAATERKGSKYQYDYSGSNNIDDVAWYEGNSGAETHDVASKKPNAFGLYDMNGNVCEFCWDHVIGMSRDYVSVGGDSYEMTPMRIGTWTRQGFLADSVSDIGFRIVRNVPAGDTTPSPVINDSAESDKTTTAEKSGKADKSKKSDKSGKSSKSNSKKDKKSKNKR